MRESQRIAVAVIDLFENLLEKHGIIIPDEDRTPDNDTPIYGCTYGDLLDAVAETIESYVKAIYVERKACGNTAEELRAQEALRRRLADELDNATTVDSALGLIDALESEAPILFSEEPVVKE